MTTSSVEQRCEPYLRAQERFERILSVAFRRFGPRLIDFSYANPYDGPEPEVVGAIREALGDDRELSFQYTPYGGATTTRRLVAEKLSKQLGLEFGFRDVVMTPGAMAALNVAFRTLCDADDELLVLTPGWLDYPLYLAQLGIPFRFVALRPDKHLDLPAIAAAIAPRTRAIVLTNPGCPSGVLLTRDELSGLAACLADAEQRHGRGIHVIADEVHRDVVWGDQPFEGAQGFHPRTLSLFSFGKALFLQGQRIGYAAVSPRDPEREALRERLVRAVRTMGYCTPTTLMQRAVVRLLDHRPPLHEIARRQQQVRSRLSGCGYELCDAKATFFVYGRAPGGDDFAFAEALARRGVMVLPSSLFHETGFFRLCVTARQDQLESGLDVLEEFARSR